MVGFMKVRLRVVRDNADECYLCGLHQHRQRVVFSRGPQSSPLMFVGEVPGREEEEGGLPFLGPSGEFLDAMISEEIEVDPWDVYMTHLVQCRPLDDRDPTAEEIEECSSYLELKIRAVRPEIVVAMGPEVVSTFGLDVDGGWRGRWHTSFGMRLLATYSPIYALQVGGKAEYLFRQDLAHVGRLLKNRDFFFRKDVDLKMKKPIKISIR